MYGMKKTFLSEFRGSYIYILILSLYLSKKQMDNTEKYVYMYNTVKRSERTNTKLNNHEDQYSVTCLGCLHSFCSENIADVMSAHLFSFLPRDEQLSIRRESTGQDGSRLSSERMKQLHRPGWMETHTRKEWHTPRVTSLLENNCFGRTCSC